MTGQRVAKVTISLPEDVLNVADQLARDRSMSRSAVIADLLKKEDEVRIHGLMEEGYREMAEENRRLAEEALPQVRETLSQHSAWPDEPRG